MNHKDEESTRIFKIGRVDIKGDVPQGTTVNEDLPIIPTRNLVLFPGVTIPLSLVRETSLKVAEEAKDKSLTIGLVCQLNADDDKPDINGLCHYGIYCKVLDVITLPDGSHTAILHGHTKFKILGRGDGTTMPCAEISAMVKEVREINPRKGDAEFETIYNQIKEIGKSISDKIGSGDSHIGILFQSQFADTDPVATINDLCTQGPFDIDKKMEMLSKYRIKERAFALYEEMVHHQEMMSIVESVHQRAKMSFDDQQRRIFLQRQMEAIDQELNGDDNDAAAFREKAKTLEVGEEVAKRIDKEIQKLERLSPQTPDYSVQYAYLDTLMQLPWSKLSPAATDIEAAREALDSGHYGLDKVKARILEQIAVLINNPDTKSPILCLVGPPGVGKTSLGRSIAEALGREFHRVSLGGLHDEAEIRGHRRTYIGAMPGRIMDAIKNGSTRNPLIMLDEIDKVGKDYKGDPSSALLEVLDPEQNCKFHDNYIDIDFDLSKVLFIATANTLNGVSQPLIDRMEVIDLSGYLLEEKIEIARRHLIPKVAVELGIEPEKLALSDDALRYVIESYTGESGVRQLEKTIASIGRKLILRSLEGNSFDKEIGRGEVREMLGVEKYSKEKYEGNQFPGVVTGLAWTAIGGEILFIESSLSAGKEQKLTLTGNLGDVMKESAMIALQYVKAHADEIGIDPAEFGKFNLHIHVPEGAIPKDGPSAGITMATSIASAFTGRLVRRGIAMTGEITLRGKVMPVGGIKEKILAAKRAGITEIILSAENRKDVEDIAELYRDGLKFTYVNTVADVLSRALLPSE